MFLHLLKKYSSRSFYNKRVIRSSIESAYAGGVKGREVIDAVLPDVHVLIPFVYIHVQKILSEDGVFYLLLEHNNVPEEVTSILEGTGLESKVNSSKCL
jgi:hypothetical protein